MAGGNGRGGSASARHPLYPVLSSLVGTGLSNSALRRVFFRGVDHLVRHGMSRHGDRPARVGGETYLMARALQETLEKIYRRPGVSPRCLQALSDIFVVKILLRSVSRRKTFEQVHGYRPPGFVTISPTNACNLSCAGCYAGDTVSRHRLPFETFDRLATDFKNLFDSHFIVVSGGEPFAYRDGGRGLLDLVARHPDVFFMAYTNGTLIDRGVARRIARLGNLVTAISVEGFEAETDQRRGRGVYRRIMSAMDNLEEAGVPFGISATPTRHNADLLLSDEFVDFYFRRRGAVFGWYFQYMPIGRNPSLELMVTPEQRFRMLQRIWRLVREEKLFIGDFWNSGTASDGCMAAGRGGGYFYVMWDGTVTPCVFIPFRDARLGNIRDVYARGGSLVDVLHSPLFAAIREWQDRYWMQQPPRQCGNLLVPCIIRDNCREFERIIRATGAVGVDGSEKGFLPRVADGRLPAYNDEYRAMVDPLWEKDYLSGGAAAARPD